MLNAPRLAMSVISLTTFVGLALAGFFIAFFVQMTNSDNGREQDALLPLTDETPNAAEAPAKHPSK